MAISKRQQKPTKQVWSIDGDLWSTDRLPMTILKPFGYTDTRSVLQIVCFWTWLVLGIGLHCYKYKQSKRLRLEQSLEQDEGTCSRQCLTESVGDDDDDNDVDNAIDVEAQATVRLDDGDKQVELDDPSSSAGKEQGMKMLATEP